MEPTALEKIAEGWIAGWEASDDSGDCTPEYEVNKWAIDAVMNWGLQPDATPLWDFILLVYRRDISQRTLGLLAAGPLEDLLTLEGPKYIARIEQLAKEDKKFAWLLGNVWRNSMLDEIWGRVQAVRLDRAP